MSGTARSPWWKALFCGVGVAAVCFAGCRKTESRSAPASETVLHPPFGYIDTPKENETIPSRSRAYGWALDDSGVRRVTASLDNGPALPAALGQSSPAIKQAYPTFPDSDKAGFVFSVPAVAAGPHLLVVTITGKDGGKTELKRHVQITSLRAE
jgi:hypothetical protein